MAAQLITQRKLVLDGGALIEINVWELPTPVPPCQHLYKYRLYFGKDGTCFVRYDNERGKGDHRHVGDTETAYVFSTLDTLLRDFYEDVKRSNP